MSVGDAGRSNIGLPPSDINTKVDGNNGVDDGSNVDRTNKTSNKPALTKNLVTQEKKLTLQEIKDLSERINLLENSTMDIDTATVIMMSVFDKTNATDMKSYMARLKTNLDFGTKLNTAKLEQFEKKAKAAAESAKSQKGSKTGSDVGLGFQVAGTVLLLIVLALTAIFTGGLSIPALIGAGIALTTTAMDVANRVAESQGATFKGLDGKEKPLEISFGGMIKRIVEQQEHDGTLPMPKGMSKEQQEKWKSDWVTGWTVVANLVVAAATIASGAMALKGVGNLAIKALTDTVKGISGQVAQVGKFLTTAAETTQIISDTGQAVSSGVAGGYGIALAQSNFEMAQAGNQKFLLEAYALRIMNDVASDQDGLKKFVEKLSQMDEKGSEMIDQVNQMKSRMVRTN